MRPAYANLLLRRKTHVLKFFLSLFLALGQVAASVSTHLGEPQNDSLRVLDVCTCFTAGTLVKVAPSTRGAILKGGSYYKAIENIKAGDLVPSYNQETGEVEYNRVARTFINKTREIVLVKYSNGTVLETTKEHPFFIKGRGWVAASKIKAGMQSVAAKGIKKSRNLIAAALISAVSIAPLHAATSQPEIVSVETVQRSEVVYNFEVENAHTYFVGEEEVLVHNDCVGLHGFGLKLAGFEMGGNPKTIQRLSETVRDLFTDDPSSIKIIAPPIEFSDDGNAQPEGPKAAVEVVHENKKTKLLVGYSMGADSAMLAGNPDDGGDWTARVAVAARADIVADNIEKIAKTGNLTIIVNIVGDKNAGNDLAPKPPHFEDPGYIYKKKLYDEEMEIRRKFGDRTPSGVADAIKAKTGLSLAQFQTKYPNVVFESTTVQPHAGGGETTETMTAVKRGYGTYYLRLKDPATNARIQSLKNSSK
ncbi:MAG: hypothetical protein HS115_17750 [Spirochaetales bacterium]|nr:hypothetical protein [Spirochaetales bacterium]